MKGRFLFLGTGASMGVPVIGCDCEVCISKSPFDKRLRPSGLIEIDGKRLLIDVGPDFKQQALTHNINTLDGVLLTHIHSDHIAGIDDLRIYNYRQKKQLGCLLSAETLDDLKVRYHYLFRPIGEVPTVSAQFELHLLEEEMGEEEFLGLKFSYVSYFQGGVKVTGYRLGDFAYISDIKEYSEEIFLNLKGVKTLVVSALRQTESPLHFNVEDGIAFGRKIEAEQTFFTHITHELKHDLKLPKGFLLAYDGLSMEFNY